MPLILFNFPKTRLVAYVTETIFDESHLQTVKYRYDSPTILDARSLAIQKALSERIRLNKLSVNGEDLLKHLRVYLEFNQANAKQGQSDDLQRHYIYFGTGTIDDSPLLALDYETALWIAADQNPPTAEVASGDLTFVVIAQCSSELLSLLAHTEVKGSVKRNSGS